MLIVQIRIEKRVIAVKKFQVHMQQVLFQVQVLSVQVQAGVKIQQNGFEHNTSDY